MYVLACQISIELNYRCDKHLVEVHIAGVFNMVSLIISVDIQSDGKRP
jgi:hypothetical protein